MLALKNFIQFGVEWKSQDELDPKEDVRFINGRAAKVILRSLADLTNVKSPTKGVKTGREGLSGFVYRRSTVSDTLKRLIALGIIQRERAKNKGSLNEDYATTYMAPPSSPPPSHGKKNVAPSKNRANEKMTQNPPKRF